MKGVDEKKGLVKVYWADVRKRVAKVEPIFAKMVDELSPGKDFPLYLAYYPYGALKGDTISTFIPLAEGGYYRLSDPNAPKDVIKHLGYGISAAPLAMLLEKNLELFIDLESEAVTIPRILYKPGSFFPLAHTLSLKSNRRYGPNGVLKLASGARSVFMLPNIGCAFNHANLLRDFNIKRRAPKSLYEHGNIFKEIVSSELVDSDWRSCLLYFSQKWVDQLLSDKAWIPLRMYFHEMVWQYSQYERHAFYYDLAFSVIQKKRNLKPNPYLADTARHLFVTALGAVPGYVPAENDDLLPTELIQTIYKESYGLKKYFPTIIQPGYYSFEQDQSPIYYSLQHPATHMFSPKSTQVSSTLAEMRELEHITSIFAHELSEEGHICSDSILGKIAGNVEFNFYHNKVDQHRVVKPASVIPKVDKRFLSTPGSGFACDAPFVRGCISIQTKS